MEISILDTHEHLWDLEARPYSWTAALPTLNRSFLPTDYSAAIAGTPITRSLHMEADVDAPHMTDENEWILSLAAEPGNPVQGAIIPGRPESESFGEYLERWGPDARVKAMRRVLHVVPDEVSQSTLFAEKLQRLPGYGMPFELCVLERQLPLAIELVAGCPDVTFVLDHCGVPAITEGQPANWNGWIRELAQVRNVNCKVSGLVAYADPEKPLADQVRPYIDHVIESFGWDRLVFGSDWPVCTMTSSAKEWVEIAVSATAGADEADRRKLFHKNAERIYGL
jgi:predicted TIM-barrel fold metal-dependent hydrolase